MLLKGAKKGCGERTGRSDGGAKGIFRSWVVSAQPLARFVDAPAPWLQPKACPPWGLTACSRDRAPPLPALYLAPNPCVSLQRGGIRSG